MNALGNAISKAFTLAGVALLLVSCRNPGGDGGTVSPESKSLATVPLVIDVRNEAPGSHCAAGGVALLSGPDLNRNGGLDPGEVRSTRYICNGVRGDTGATGAMGTNGRDGANALIAVHDEPIGTACPTGGKSLSVGLDSNGNGTLDPSEVTDTQYVCNGNNGADGRDGKNTLVILIPQGVGGAQCPFGGQGIYTGVDENGDGLLAPTEVSQTAFVCNGAPGAPGTNGANGTNGINGAMALIDQTPEPAGIHCSNGGTRIDSGLDVNADHVLQVAEIDRTAYACNGAPGPAGTGGGTRVKAISMGDWHTCALLGDGTVKCWGFGEDGELGNGAAASSSVPVPVSGLSGVVTVAAGGVETCAVLSDTTVKCWGNPLQGVFSTPFAVPGLTGVASLAMGTFHDCALLTDGSVRCWGSNGYGQLGNGSTANSISPVAVSGLTGVVALNAGDYNNFAILADGTARSWGYNNNGGLGDGTYSDSSVPVVVSGLSGVVAIEAGYTHACALLGDRTVRCWGSNAYGELGDGTNNYSLSPVTVAGLGGVASIATGEDHTCAALTDGTTRCWGSNFSGELGNGTAVHAQAPVGVTGLAGIATVQLSSGVDDTCALLTDGTVACWGDNTVAELGDGSGVSESLIPVFVVGL